MHRNRRSPAPDCWQSQTKIQTSFSPCQGLKHCRRSTASQGCSGCAMNLHHTFGKTNTRDTQSHFSAACTKHGSMSGCQNTPPPSCQLTCVSNSTAPTNRDYQTSRVSCSLKHKLIGTTARHTSCRAVTKLVNDTGKKAIQESINPACMQHQHACCAKQTSPTPLEGCRLCLPGNTQEHRAEPC